MSKLNDDIRAAMKDRDAVKLSTLRQVVGLIQSAEKAGKVAVEFTDEQVVSFLSKEVKKRQETASIYANANQDARAAKEIAEADIIKAYLPQALDEGEVEKIIDEAIKETGATDIKSMGKVMKIVTGKTSGRADGKKVSDLVRKKLS